MIYPSGTLLAGQEDSSALEQWESRSDEAQCYSINWQIFEIGVARSDHMTVLVDRENDIFLIPTYSVCNHRLLSDSAGDCLFHDIKGLSGAFMRSCFLYGNRSLSLHKVYDI